MNSIVSSHEEKMPGLTSLGIEPESFKGVPVQRNEITDFHKN